MHSKKLFIFAALAAFALPAAAAAAAITGDGMALASSLGTSVSASLGAGTTSAEITATANVDAGPLTLTSGDAGDAAVTISSPGQVSTDADFTAYAIHQLKSDANVRTVSATSDSVSMTYRVPAYFLGLFPASLSSTVEVRADGSVQVTHPWYGFFYSTNDASVATKLATTSAMSASTAPTLSAAEKAALLAQLHLAFSMSAASR